MIIFKNVKNINGEIFDLEVNAPDQSDQIIDASHLTVLPGLIDPHVHFRTPGLEQKEDWCTASQAAIHGGYTTVFDMPNTKPPTITAELLAEKKAIINAQLAEINIPLRYQLFFGADKHHLAEISKVQNDVIGIKVFMGCSTGNLVVDDDESLHAIFSMAAKLNMLVAVHAEDEHLLQQRTKKYGDCNHGYSIHSKIRNEEVAVSAVQKAIGLTREYGTKLYILHTSTAGEMALIKAAKRDALPVYAEVTPHHLFLSDQSYEKLGSKAVMNPPLRPTEHQAVLFQAIKEGTLDTVGTDHAPHTLSEKDKPYGQCPCGVPGIETALPLLLNAYHQGLLTLNEIVSLTSTRAQKIFNLPPNNDCVLVDLNLEQQVNDQNLKTKCGWSPFSGMTLRGWPVYTILQNRVFDLRKI